MPLGLFRASLGGGPGADHITGYASASRSSVKIVKALKR